MPRRRRVTKPQKISRPQNLGQNRNVQMRNNARPIGTFQGGLELNKAFGEGQSGQGSDRTNYQANTRGGRPQGGPRGVQQPGQCPAGQQPKMVNGKMQCVAGTSATPVAPRPKSGKGY